jgi:RNA polymerase sigma-70 factor (ECF subfamily)
VTAEEAFDRYHETVFRFVFRMTRRADTAEDITQDCFLAFMRGPERFDHTRGTVKTYLLSIARNLTLKEYRDHRAEAPLADEFAPAVDLRRDFEVSSAVESAVAGLPPLQQEALILFEYEGCTLEEVAEIAGTDTGAIKSRLHRARERLRMALAPYRNAGGVRGTA